MSSIVKSKSGERAHNARERFAFGFLRVSNTRKRPSKRRFSLRNTLRGLAIVAITFGGYAAVIGLPKAQNEAGRNLLASAASKLGFEIDAIRLTGNKMVSEQTVLFALDTKPNEAIFAFNVREAKQRVENLNWVESVSIQRLWPDTLQVAIVERTPFALWQTGGKVFVIDRFGKQLEEMNGQIYGALPMVVGEGANIGAHDLVQMMAAYPALQSQVQAYVRVAERRWNLRLQNGADVKLPEENMDEALALLAALDKKEAILKRDIEFVDLRLSDRVTMRLTEAAQAKLELEAKAAQDAKKAAGRT